MMEEIWKDIPGFEGRYQVSNLGHIRRLAYTYKKNNRWGVFDYKNTPGIQREWIGKDGYHRVSLSIEEGKRKNLLVHRLVAIAFLDGGSDNLDVNHIDENKDHNYLSNLEWVTRKQNLNHGTHNARATAHNVRRAVVQMTKTGEFVAEYGSQLEASKKTGIDVGSISNACKGKTKSAGGYRWRYTEE